ncbi:MAG TPA: HAMP domain-containing sensor histidine kinase [Opitutaceae bacterium]
MALGLLLAADLPPPPRIASEVLLRQSEQIEHKDLGASLELARKALAAEASPAQDVRARIAISRLERERADYARAWTDANDAVRRARALGDGDLEAQALFELGRVQWTTSELAPAVATYREGLPLAEKANDRWLQVHLHLGLGVAFEESGDAAGERREYARALELARASGNDGAWADALTDVGNSQWEDGHFAAARDDYEQAMSAYLKIGDEWGVGTSQVNLGSAAESLGDLATALSDYRQAEGIFRRADLARHLANTERQLGVVLAKLGREKESSSAFALALAQAARLKSHTVSANIYRDQSVALKAEGHFPEALEAQRRFGEEHEAAAGERTQSMLAEANTRYVQARNEAEIASLREEQSTRSAEASRLRARAYGLIGLLLGATLALASVAWSLRSADRFKTRLLSMAAHDIKAPLGNIRAIAEDLRREKPDERIDWIAVESTRLLRLVQDLLDTAAFEIGRLEIRREPVDLSAVVAEAVSDHRWHLQDKRQRLTGLPTAAGSVWVRGDADRLHQVVANILGNAVKFGPAGSEITVALSLDGAQCELSIRDQGPGLSAQDRRGLFRAFSRRSARPTGKEKSHGLGLSIAEEIVRLHGGTIGVRSEPGKGADFFIRLPVDVAPATC